MTKHEDMSAQEYEWMIRPCEMYLEEYQDCKSIRARFHQYFVHGEKIDCSQWNIDYKNCCLWENHKSQEAFDQLIHSEKTRRYERLKGHYSNNVWEKRDTPPENWNVQLPQWAKDKIAVSQLKLMKDKVEKGEKLPQFSESSCTIM